jgi:hypothetical protein
VNARDDEEYVRMPRSTMDRLAGVLADGHEHDSRVAKAAHEAGRRQVTRDLAAEAKAEKATQRQLLEALRAAEPPERWRVRGEQRTRETFGAPHPRDFPGRERQRQAEEREREAG